MKRISADEVLLNGEMFKLGVLRLGHLMDPEWGPNVPAEPMPWNPPVYVQGRDEFAAWEIYVEISVGAM